MKNKEEEKILQNIKICRLCEKLKKLPSEIKNEDENNIDFIEAVFFADTKRQKIENKRQKHKNKNK